MPYHYSKSFSVPTLTENLNVYKQPNKPSSQCFKTGNPGKIQGQKKSEGRGGYVTQTEHFFPNSRPSEYTFIFYMILCTCYSLRNACNFLTSKTQSNQSEKSKKLWVEQGYITIKSVCLQVPQTVLNSACFVNAT